MNPRKTVRLGPEYNATIHQALKTTLALLSAVTTKSDWGVGGSQELGTWEVLIDGEPLTVESETYMGLTITGAEEIVDRVASLIQKQLGHV